MSNFLKKNEMKWFGKSISLALIFLLLLFTGASAQGLLKKAAQKLQKDAEKMLLDDNDDASQPVSDPSINDNFNNSYGNTGSAGNGSSGKKKMKPPDVNKNIAAAQSSLDEKNYDGTRFAVQQALIGVELEIGYQVLEALPKSLNGIQSDPEDDEISSTGVGFAGLNIGRDYRSDAQYIDLGIMNNAGILGLYTGVIANPAYADENQKGVMVNGYKGMLEADEGGYYNLGIPFGQTSVIVMKFENFEDEDKVLAIAEKIDISKIKELLGEQ